MNRKEAVEMAVKIVDEWCKTPVKSNGYPVDGWKTPTLLMAKTYAVKALADFLWDADDDVVASVYRPLEDEGVRFARPAE